MPIIVEPFIVSAAVGAPTLDVIRAGIHDMDDCPVLRRIKAFIVDQGLRAVLEHTVRDRQGRPVDLSAYLEISADVPGSESSQSLGIANGSATLRVKDILGAGSNTARNPVWEVAVTGYDPLAGIVRSAKLPASLVERSGIYQLSWAIKDSNGEVILINDGLLSIERSLYPSSNTVLQKDLGPPTVNEIRMAIMDSDPTENQYLLDNLEFGDEQIVQAIVAPVEFWNEVPPPIRKFTTRDFPFRWHWKQGIAARLHIVAAAHYRRNFLQGHADDKGKEREYLNYGQNLWGEYTQWVHNKKVEINLKGFRGEVWSAYSGRSGW